MAKRKLEYKLISYEDIKEELRLIYCSDTDYITPTGKIYKLYEDNKFYPKRNHVNNANGYTYCGITCKDRINRTKRVHVLVAIAYIPNPYNYKVVGHKNNIKSCTDVKELYWTTVSENTKKAFDDGLAKNAKGFADSQSINICVYTVDLLKYVVRHI